MKSKGQNTGQRARPTKPPVPAKSQEQAGLEAAARVIAAGGRVPKKIGLAVAAGAQRAGTQAVQARPASAGPTLGVAAALAKITPARLVAFEILTFVAAGKAHSDELLHGARTQALAEADRHLATALVMGVLRWQIALDARIRALLERPNQALPEPVLLALRLGAFQLLYMDRIPAHAALSESVELCRAAGHPHASGMVNAILRKLAAASAASTQKQPGQPIFESTAALAERLGHPLWLVERWVRHYGREAALKICAADQVEPDSGDLFGAALFEADPALPQIDAGSRLVAELAAAAVPEIAGRPARVWDACAAPGGKTLVLARRLPDAEFLATDVSPRRLAQMQARFGRHAYAGAIETAVADATQLPETAGQFDLILCDVPCSGTGTLARNPEIRFRLKQEDLARQAERQSAILNAALKRLAPGGRVVYSTCSLEREENEQVAAQVPDEFTRVSVAGLLESVAGLQIPPESVIQNDALRTLPGLQACDGFYAVVFEAQAQR